MQVRRNFNQATHNAVVLAASIGEEEMREQIAFYHTMPGQCSCGQTRLVTALFHVDVACCHRYGLVEDRAVRPKMDIPPSLTTFLMTPKWQRLVVLLPREDAALGDERKEFLKLLAAEVIKRRSHSWKSIEEIAAWVDDRCAW
jgi:hypothetical protein